MTFTRTDKQKILSALSEELEKLSEVFVLYLNLFVESTLEDINQENNLERCGAIYHIDQAITFNYTSTYEKLYYNSCFHLHGELNNKIILGINPDKKDQIETIDISLLPFKKYFQRAKLGTDEKYLLWLHKYANCKPGENSLMIMGHSLDISDADIIKELFEHADEIIILYHDDTAKASYISKLINMFGKEKFDQIRQRCDVKFWSQSMDFSEFREKRSEEAFARLNTEMLSEMK